MRIVKSRSNSEVYKADKDEVLPTNRRWIQFLDAADKITQGYIDGSHDHNDRVNISELAKQKYGYEIKGCDDPLKFIHELSQDRKYRAVLKGALEENE